MGEVSRFTPKGRLPIRELIDQLEAGLDEIDGLLVAVTYKPGDGERTSGVMFSPITGADFAYLSKQIDAEFMANYIFPDFEEE